MNGGQQAKLSGILPNTEVEAAGAKVWEIHSTGSVRRPQRDWGPD